MTKQQKQTNQSRLKQVIKEPILKIINPLTKSEMQTLLLILEGYCSRDIATELHKSEDAIDSIRRKIISKSNANNMNQVVAIAFRQGWVN